MNIKVLKPKYHGCSPIWNQSRGGEACSNGCYWPILCLSQQTVHVTGQTGGGAHCVVPQNKDRIIQPVQTILHSRLGGPEGLKGLRVAEKRRGKEQLSISTLGQKLKTLIAWFGLKNKRQQRRLKRNINWAISASVTVLYYSHQSLFL